MEDQKDLKFDEDKLDWTLLPFEAVEEVVKILDHGKKKYSANSWQKVRPVDRYASALLRHFVARLKGEVYDKESGLSHSSHMACNALFLTWFDLKGINDADIAKRK